MKKEDIVVKPEDILVLIDGKRIRYTIPKEVINDYISTGKPLDFESTYSICNIVIKAKNVEEAIEKYKEIKSNLLED